MTLFVKGKQKIRNNTTSMSYYTVLCSANEKYVFFCSIGRMNVCILKIFLDFQFLEFLELDSWKILAQPNLDMNH